VSIREQLDWEARWAKPAAVAAFLGAFLSVAATAVRLSALSDNTGDDRELLLAFHDNSGAFAASLGLQALSFFLIAAALYYLMRAVRHRRPELPSFMVGFLVVAPLALVVGGVIDQVSLRDAADAFTASGPETVRRAEDLLEDRAVLGAAIGSLGTLCLAISFVFAGVNAMRVGLLSRFMGILGVIVGALLVLPLVPGGQGVIQLFWLGALGVLFLGRWPGGRGPAWETGEAIEWPSGTARQGEPSSRIGEEPDAGRPNGGGTPTAAEGNGDPGGRTRSSRKRKRR
jgi:hypothetical protein